MASIRHHALQADVRLHEGQIDCTSTLTLSQPELGEEMCIILNHGLFIDSISTQGEEIAFDTTITKVFDHAWVSVCQASFLMPLGETLVIRYHGEIKPYQEVWSYVRDHITPSFAILRKDAFAYPMLAWKAQDHMWEVRHDRFTYDVALSVPKGMKGLCGGYPSSQNTVGQKDVFCYKSLHAVDRMDMLIGKYVLSDNKKGDVRLCLFADSLSIQHTQRLHHHIKSCRALFTRLLGSMPHQKRIAFMEIGMGYGGQATDEYIIQQSYAFTNPHSIDGIYHEIAHAWTTVQPVGLAKGKRFFDEAIASYMQVLATRYLHGEVAEAVLLEKMRKSFEHTYHQIGDKTKMTLAHHGHEGHIAYHKGAWMLKTLETNMGESAFLAALREFIHTYHRKQAGFPEFIKCMSDHAALPLVPFFDNWLFGVESTTWMLQAVYPKK